MQCPSYRTLLVEDGGTERVECLIEPPHHPMDRHRGLCIDGSVLTWSGLGAIPSAPAHSVTTSVRYACCAHCINYTDEPGDGCPIVNMHVLPCHDCARENHEELDVETACAKVLQFPGGVDV